MWPGAWTEGRAKERERKKKEKKDGRHHKLPVLFQLHGQTFEFTEPDHVVPFCHKRASSPALRRSCVSWSPLRRPDLLPVYPPICAKVMVHISLVYIHFNNSTGTKLEADTIQNSHTHSHTPFIWVFDKQAGEQRLGVSREGSGKFDFFHKNQFKQLLMVLETQPKETHARAHRDRVWLNTQIKPAEKNESPKSFQISEKQHNTHQ